MERARHGEILLYFLRLGTVGFGGPSAHIAMMHDQLVRRRGWVSEQRFLEMLGASNLIPGPSSTALAIHLGYARGRRLGGALAGLGFLLPPFLMVIALSWAYVTFGSSPVRSDLLAGIQPVVPAVVLLTLWRLRRAFTDGPLPIALWAAGFALTLAFPRLAPIVMVAGGLTALALRPRGAGTMTSIVPFAVVAGLVVASDLAGISALAWVFLRTGLLLFGGGLVLLPLLEPEVLARGWLTRPEFLDGIAIGQATPGPVVITAAFVGYNVGGVTGALVATVAIVVPTFVLVVAGTGPLLERFRENPEVAAFVRGVTATALGAVAGSAVLLMPSAVGTPFRGALFAVGALVLLRSRRVPVVLVVLGGAVLGLLGGSLGWT